MQMGKYWEIIHSTVPCENLNSYKLFLPLTLYKLFLPKDLDFTSINNIE